MARRMKDSGVEWIGEIPENWDTIKIKYTSWLKGRIGWQGLKSNEYQDDGAYLITGTDFGNGKINWNSCVHISNDRFEEDKDIHIKEDDLLITKDGTIGKVAIVKNCPEKVSLNSGVLLIRNTKNIKYYNKYLFFTLLSDQFWTWYEMSQTGNSTIRHLYQEQFYNFEFALPIVEEQKKIADFLDEKVEEIDSVIVKTKDTIEDYKKYKQKIITDAVTKGMNPDVEMKESKSSYLGMIPVHWSEKRLRFLGMCQNGISKSSEYFGEGYPFISYGDVYNNYALTESGSGLIKSSKDDRIIYSVQYGDVFFTRTSETIEEVGFASTCLKTIDDATFAGFIIRFRPNNQEELCPQFSKYYFRSDVHRKFFVKEMNLVTRASLSQELLKKLPVLLPPIEEQKEIAKYLDKECFEIDKLIRKKEELLADLESYKKSSIYEYVTGKRRFKWMEEVE